MNLVNWNVRGLGWPSKRFLVKDFLIIHHAEVCCLQETKLEEISLATWREISGSHLDQFAFVPVRGSAGGIAVGWNNVLLTGILTMQGEFSLMMKFCSKVTNLT